MPFPPEVGECFSVSSQCDNSILTAGDSQAGKASPFLPHLPRCCPGRGRSCRESRERLLSAPSMDLDALKSGRGSEPLLCARDKGTHPKQTRQEQGDVLEEFKGRTGLSPWRLCQGKKKSQRGFVRFGLQIPRDITRIYPISLSGAALLDVNLQNSQD